MRLFWNSFPQLKLPFASWPPWRTWGHAPSGRIDKTCLLIGKSHLGCIIMEGTSNPGSSHPMYEAFLKYEAFVCDLPGTGERVARIQTAVMIRTRP